MQARHFTDVAKNATRVAKDEMVVAAKALFKGLNSKAAAKLKYEEIQAAKAAAFAAFEDWKRLTKIAEELEAVAIAAKTEAAAAEAEATAKELEAKEAVAKAEALEIVAEAAKEEAAQAKDDKAKFDLQMIEEMDVVKKVSALSLDATMKAIEKLKGVLVERVELTKKSIESYGAESKQADLVSKQAKKLLEEAVPAAAKAGEAASAWNAACAAMDSEKAAADHAAACEPAAEAAEEAYKEAARKVEKAYKVAYHEAAAKITAANVNASCAECSAAA